MKICTVGLGYIGLPTAIMLANRGHDVLGFDTSEKVVASISAGQAHFHEPELQGMLDAALATGRLRAACEPSPSDCFIIAVPTPIKEKNTPDMRHVDAAALSIAPVLKRGDMVILESTSPVGSTERLRDVLARERSDLTFPEYQVEGVTSDVAISYCPERIMPGQMLRELVSNDRIIGGMTLVCAQRALALYETFVTGRCYTTEARIAELVKLSENAYRDVNIAFANELSLICERFEIDMWTVRSLANRHPRVEILRPGAGVGGHCIAVDPWFIVHSAPEQARLIRAAREVNDSKPGHVVANVRALASRLKNPVIACFGITYKPDVDDIRESPALQIVEALADTVSVRLLVCEPNLSALPASLAARSNVELVGSDQAVRDADVLAFLVAHSSFKSLPPEVALSRMVVDAVGLFAQEHDQRAYSHHAL